MHGEDKSTMLPKGKFCFVINQNQRGYDLQNLSLYFSINYYHFLGTRHSVDEVFFVCLLIEQNLLCCHHVLFDNNLFELSMFLNFRPQWYDLMRKEIQGCKGYGHPLPFCHK